MTYTVRTLYFARLARKAGAAKVIRTEDGWVVLETAEDYRKWIQSREGEDK